MFQQDNTYPMKNLSREVAAGFENKKLDTVIDGCHVTMRFSTHADDSALKNVRGILKNAYLKSLSD